MHRKYFGFFRLDLNIVWHRLVSTTEQATQTTEIARCIFCVKHLHIHLSYTFVVKHLHIQCCIILNAQVNRNINTFQCEEGSEPTHNAIVNLIIIRLTVGSCYFRVRDIT